MSNCDGCQKAFVCDWETAPDNCQDFSLGVVLDIASQVYEHLDEECEVLTRGGGKSVGVIRGIDGGYMLLHRSDKTVEALDTQDRILIRRKKVV